MLFVPLKLLSLTGEAIMSYFPDPTEIYCNRLVRVNCQNCLTCTDKFVLCTFPPQNNGKGSTNDDDSDDG